MKVRAVERCSVKTRVWEKESVRFIKKINKYKSVLNISLSLSLLLSSGDVFKKGKLDDMSNPERCTEQVCSDSGKLELRSICSDGQGCLGDNE